MTTQPSLYIPHGGGPCLFMDDPAGTWTGMGEFLRGLPARLPEPPRAILIVSGHWETRGFAFTGAARPPLIYDYRGFPPHTYALRYDVPGDPALAARAAALLTAAGLEAAVDPERGLNHGVFVPLKVAFPDADVPVVEMSLERGLDPAVHMAAGRALGVLRHEGVLVIGAGMRFHNMRGYGDPGATEPARRFDDWLDGAVADPAALLRWREAPAARFSHPREEHLLPLMVAAGAGGAGTRIYAEEVLHTRISGFAFA